MVHAQPTISGTPDNPDVRQVHILYDTTGSLTISVDFWHPVSSLDTSQNYAFWGNFLIGTAGVIKSSFPDIPDYTYCDTSSNGSLSAQHHVYAKYSTFFDQASIVGYGGTLTFSRTISPDNT